MATTPSDRTPVPTPALPPLIALRAQRGDVPLLRGELNSLLRHPTPTRVAWLLDVARAECSLGLLDEGAQRLGNAVVQAFRRNDAEGLAEAWRLQVELLLTRGDYGSARDLVSQIEWLATGRACPEHWARHAESKGWLLLRTGSFATGEYPEAFSCFERARTCFREIGDTFGEIRAIEGLANTSAALGQYMDAIANVDEGLKLSSTLGEWRVAHRLLCQRALALRDQGYRMPAWDAMDLAISWSEESGDPVTLSRCLLGLGVLLGYRVDPTDSETAIPAFESLERALALARESDAGPLAMEILLAVAEIRQLLGDELGARRAREDAGCAVDPLVGEHGRELVTRREMEREVIEKSRRERESRRMREAIEGSPDALFVFDTCRQSDGTVIDLLNEFRNTAGDRLIGAEDQQVRLLTELVDHPFFFDLGSTLLTVASSRIGFEDAIEIRSDFGVTRYVRRAVPMTDGVAVTIRKEELTLPAAQPNRSIA